MAAHAARAAGKRTGFLVRRRETMAAEPRPKRMPLWLAVVLNVLYGRPFHLAMHGPDGDWATCNVGDSFGRALRFHRHYRKLGYR
jgi:hypothetical protein